MEDNAKQVQKLQLMLSGYQQDKAQLDLRLMDARADVTLLEQELVDKNQALEEARGELEQAKIQIDLLKNPPPAKETNEQFAKRRQAEAKAKLAEQNEPEAEVPVITTAK